MSDPKIEDNLDQIWRLQKEYNEMVFARDQRFHTIYKTIDQRISAISTAIIHEAVELQRETNWKWWKQAKEFNIPKAQEELIDIQHFVTWAAQELGMTAQQFFNRYLLKNEINRERQRSGY